MGRYFTPDTVLRDRRQKQVMKYVFHLTCLMPILGKCFRQVTVHFGDKQNSQTLKLQLQKFLALI